MVRRILSQRILLQGHIFKPYDRIFVIVGFKARKTNFIFYSVFNVLPVFGIPIKIFGSFFIVLFLEVGIPNQQLNIVFVLRFWFLRQHFFAVRYYLVQVAFFVKDLDQQGRYYGAVSIVLLRNPQVGFRTGIIAVTQSNITRVIAGSITVFARATFIPVE